MPMRRLALGSVRETIRSAEATHERSADFLEAFSKRQLIDLVLVLQRRLGAAREEEAFMMELPDAGAASLAYPDRSSIADILNAAPLDEDRVHHLVHHLLSRLLALHAQIGSADRRPEATSCLSPREMTVLQWMKEGKTNWEIAKILGLSERTVRFHVGSIFEKLDVTSRTQAVAQALDTGLIAS